MATKKTAGFDELARQVLENNTKPTVTVRELLHLFGQAKRGREVTRFIKYKLRYKGLETVPDFDRSHIDATVTIQPRKGVNEIVDKTDKGATRHVSIERVTLTAQIEKEIDADEQTVPFITVGLVLPPNRPLHCVRPNDPFSKVVTLLMMENVSHVPVLQSQRKAEGMVTWKSVGTALHSGREIKSASDCMESNPRVITLHTPLLRAIEEVLQFGAVLVEGEDKSIKGIFTADDVAKQFITSAQPFLILEEIENCLRKLICKLKLTEGELKAFVDPLDEKRKARLKGIADLTFGEYASILACEKTWPKFSLPLDRSLFGQRLQQVREIRNSVMHFHPDGITTEERQTLIGFRDLLRQL